jgi:hypothetical protein
VRKVSGGPTIERKAAVPTARLELLLGFAIGLCVGVAIIALTMAIFALR